jgi:hypothetical protein
LHPIIEIGGNRNNSVRYQLNIQTLIGVQSEVHFYAVVLIHPGCESFFNCLIPMLATNDFERVVSVVLGRELSNKIAETAPLLSVLLHPLEGHMTGNNLTVGSVFWLLFRVKRDVCCGEGNEFAASNVAFTKPGICSCIDEHVEKLVGLTDFSKTDTTPVIAKSGEEDEQWETIRKRKPSIWKDTKLDKAGSEFSALVRAQRESFKGQKGNVDFQEKALNYAVLSAWAYVAGLVNSNDKRLTRHYELKLSKGKDPLKASALAKGRHKTDSENYRGLGYRTDAKERGRFVELFYAQAEKGEGITPGLINVAIAKYHAKQAMLDVAKAESTGE